MEAAQGCATAIPHLILVALDAALTNVQPEDLRGQIANALAAGATIKEVPEVLELTTVLGFHAITISIPILLEELAARGEGLDLGPLSSDHEKALKENFIKVRVVRPVRMSKVPCGILGGAP